jgi:hypothetical protein
MVRGIATRPGQAEVLISLGQLSSRTGASQQARSHYGQVLAIARDLGLPFAEVRALERIAASLIEDGHAVEGARHP